MVFWQRSHEGEVFVDHRASPGLPAHIAEKFGYDPKLAGEGKLFEAATMMCSHCGTRVIKRTDRTRERATCLKCSNHYICDWCDAERRKPGYVHRPYTAIKEEFLKWRSGPSQPAFPTQPPPPLVLQQPAGSTWPSKPPLPRS